MVLPRLKILEYIKKNQIIVENFDEKCLEPASYDIRLGNEGITSSLKKKIDIIKKGYLVIEPGEFAIFLTLEYFKMPNNLVGNIGMKSKFARKGLIFMTGLQIDPGFEGYLVIRALNTGTNNIIIPREEKIGMVQFLELITPVQLSYEGPYQKQLSIPTEDIAQVIETEGITMGNVIKSIQGLINSVTTLRDSQEKYEKRMEKHEKRLEWIFGITIGALGILTTISIFF